jgi:hypothetical protein
MKKILLSLFLLAGGYTAMSQTANTTMNNAATTGITATTYAALPVLETDVPQNVMDKLKSKYGDALYDITTVKSTTTPGQMEYVARVWDNTQYRTDYIGEDGNPVAIK